MGFQFPPPPRRFLLSTLFFKGHLIVKNNNSNHLQLTFLYPIFFPSFVNMYIITLVVICCLYSTIHITSANTIKLPINKISTTHDNQFIHNIQKRSIDQKNNSNYKSLLYNDDGTEYLISISVGTPPQDFRVALDTGR